ncbi:MAG: hypothetical protein ACOX2R_00340 [Anaerolineae bacterium]
MYDANEIIDDFDTIEGGMGEIHVGFNRFGDVEGRLEHRIHEYEQTRDYYGEQAAGSLVEWLEVQGF